MLATAREEAAKTPQTTSPSGYRKHRECLARSHRVMNTA